MIKLQKKKKNVTLLDKNRFLKYISLRLAMTINGEDSSLQVFFLIIKNMKILFYLNIILLKNIK